MAGPFIYHMVEEERWRPHAAEGAAGYLPAAFVEEGFIHCSMDYLVLPVANHFLKGVKDKFLCLQIDPKLLEAEVKYESGRSKRWAEYGKPVPSNEDGGKQVREPVVFPHIYGSIHASAVVAELGVMRAEDGVFLSVEGLS